jgi:carbonic anhydrase
MVHDHRSPGLKLLLDGNARWALGHPTHPHRDIARRQLVAKDGQRPFAAILSCADSRVPSELLFDVGLGDLFVVRVAGNSLDKIVQQSLEYAAAVLGVETIMIMGHQGCGAVTGAIEAYPGPAPEFLSTIYRAIEKSKEVLRDRGVNPEDKDALGLESVDRHVLRSVNKLRLEHPFDAMIAQGKLTIVGGRYDLDSGRVTMLIE